MKIRKSHIEDISAMQLLFAQAKEKMRATGNMHQWTGDYPSNKLLEEDIAKGQSYVVEREGNLVATFVMAMGEDPTYKKIYEGAWTDDETPYATIHRIASAHEVSGIFSEVMRYAFSHIDNVRVDTHPDNTPMRYLLGKWGFTECGIIYLMNGDLRLAFQRKLTTIKQRLNVLADKAYKEFTAPLIPNISPDSILGVRAPHLKWMTSDIWKHHQSLLNSKSTKEGATAVENNIQSWWNELPHATFDEMNLHGALLSKITDYGTCLDRLEAFLPHIDNWATCDSLKPASFAKKENHKRLLQDIKRWLASEHPYTIRFGINMLMTHFLDEEFQPSLLQWVAACHQNHYYIRMMVAWYFATALAKQWEASIPYLTKEKLEVWTHNKTIQKAIESFRITNEQKNYLKTIRRKN